MLNKFTIDDFPVLQLEHVYMKDKSFVINVINEILHGGVDHLQVVTDFDLTLTKQHVNGTHGLSSFGVFKKCTQLPKSFKEEATKLYFKYRPIEIDPILSSEEKIKAMEDWMIATNDLLNGIEFDPQELDDIVKLYATDLRDGTNELFQKLNTSCVPVLVFSAGLGDVVQAILRCHNILFDNVTVVSNFLKYNGNRLAGFKNERSIHVFNKNEHTLDEEHLKLLEERQNVLLMGDSLGDANMVEGMDNVKNVLKIGFLYDHVEKSLDSYMNAFDIVLVDDQTMRVVDDIFKNML